MVVEVLVVVEVVVLVGMLPEFSECYKGVGYSSFLLQKKKCVRDWILRIHP